MRFRGWARKFPRTVRIASLHASGSMQGEVYLNFQNEKGEHLIVEMSHEEAEEMLGRVEVALEAVRRRKP